MASTAVPRRQIFVRPRSEIITVLDWQQVSNEGPEQWRSETCLDSEFFDSEKRGIKAGYVCGSYEFTRDLLGESDSETVQDVAEQKLSENNPEVKRSVLTVNLKPASVQVKPKLVKAQSMASLPRKVEFDNDTSQDKAHERSGGLNHRKSSLDVSLAKLRHEMNSLRRQDMELLEQLLNLNNSIQDFKLSQHGFPFDSSDESDHGDIPMENPLKPKRWHSRGSLGSGEFAMEKPMKPKRWRSQGSLGSNGSDHSEIALEKGLEPKRWGSRGSLCSNESVHGEIAMEKPLKPKRMRSRGSVGSKKSDHGDVAMEKPLKPKRWLSRGSLGSDGSDYNSASSRSSIGSGSAPSLSGSDISSYDSGHESGAGLKSCRRGSKGKFGSMDLRRVSFGTVSELSGSEVFVNGSQVVFPAQAVRRDSDFRVAEIKSLRTLSKRQSTIW